MTGPLRLLVALGLLAVIISVDHGMRLDQRSLCQRDDRVLCPTGLWLWEEW